MGVTSRPKPGVSTAGFKNWIWLFFIFDFEWGRHHLIDYSDFGAVGCAHTMCIDGLVTQREVGCIEGEL